MTFIRGTGLSASHKGQPSLLRLVWASPAAFAHAQASPSPLNGEGARGCGSANGLLERLRGNRAQRAALGGEQLQVDAGDAAVDADHVIARVHQVDRQHRGAGLARSQVGWLDLVLVAAVEPAAGQGDLPMEPDVIRAAERLIAHRVDRLDVFAANVGREDPPIVGVDGGVPQRFVGHVGIGVRLVDSAQQGDPQRAIRRADAVIGEVAPARDRGGDAVIPHRDRDIDHLAIPGVERRAPHDGHRAGGRRGRGRRGGAGGSSRSGGGCRAGLEIRRREQDDLPGVDQVGVLDVIVRHQRTDRRAAGVGNEAQRLVGAHLPLAIGAVGGGVIGQRRADGQHGQQQCSQQHKQQRSFGHTLNRPPCESRCHSRDVNRQLAQQCTPDRPYWEVGAVCHVKCDSAKT